MSARTLQQAVRLCVENGIEVPEHLKKYAKTIDRINRGVKEVWRCGSRKCKAEYEYFVPVKQVECKCGTMCRKVFPSK